MISLLSSGMPYTVGKISTRATTLLQISPQSEVCTQNYDPPKLQESQFRNFLGVPGQNGI